MATDTTPRAPRPDVRRMWINQPSTIQPLHHLHGLNVLAYEEHPGAWRCFPLHGDVVSFQALSLCLSPGWRPAAAPSSPS